MIERTESPQKTGAPPLLIIGVVAVAVLAMLSVCWTLGAMDLYSNTAQSVRRTDFDVEELLWDQDSRTLELSLAAFNGGTMDVGLETTRFSVYINGVYVATNTETIMNQSLEPNDRAVFHHRLVLRPFFADAIREGLRHESPTWSVRGTVWLSVGEIKTDIPLRIRRAVNSQ